MANYILMADVESALKTGVLEEKVIEIAKGTFQDIIGLSEETCPDEIYLYNGPQTILIQIVVKLGLMFEDYNEQSGRDINIPIFTATPQRGHMVLMWGII